MHPLSQVDHRPWALPRSPWIMAQTWHDLLFAHWACDPALLQPHIPPQLTLDTFNGQAWIALVPFWMSGVRPRATIALPWLSSFPELNLRTYVVRDGKPGVWFWSLDAANPVAVRIARSVFHLPYFDARMQIQRSGERFHYTSERTHRGARPAAFVAEYGPVAPVALAEPGSLVHWFTERYCLYTVHREHVYRAEIHHQPWPLQAATAIIRINTVAASFGLPCSPEPPILHFVRRLDVVVWPLRRLLNNQAQPTSL